MSHSPFEKKLGPWLDGELTEAEALEVARHVRECGVCRSRVDEMRRLSSAIRQIERHPMPVDLKERLISETQSGPDAPADVAVLRRSPWLLASVAAAAGVVLVVLALRPGAEADRPVIAKPVEIAMNPREISSTESKTEPPESIGDSSRGSLASRPEPVSAPAKPPRGLTTSPSVVAPDQISSNVSKQAAPEQRAPSAQPASASPVARYKTHLILKASEAPVLGPIVPAVPDVDTGPIGTPITREWTFTPTAGSATSTIPPPTQEPAQTSMMFLVRVDQDGRVLSVDPVGARLVSPETARIVRALLVASTLPPREQGDPALVVVEVLVTGAR